MVNISDYVAAQSGWLVPVAAVLIYLVLESLWEAYSRKKNYAELKILNELRVQGIITEEEFQVKKEFLLAT